MEKNTYRSYFEGKTCDLCKAPASLYRFSTKLNKGQMVCNNAECDYKSLVRNGYITLLIIPEVK